MIYNNSFFQFIVNVVASQDGGLNIGLQWYSADSDSYNNRSYYSKQTMGAFSVMGSLYHVL